MSAFTPYPADKIAIEWMEIRMKNMKEEVRLRQRGQCQCYSCRQPSPPKERLYGEEEINKEQTPS